MHCHILPGVDDGSQDVETSLKMIERLKQQGAKKIVLTPHYYSNEISLDDFLKCRDKAFEKLTAALPEDSPKLYTAAEVYISDYLFNNDSLDRLRYGNSHYVLIEHPFSSSFSSKDFDRLTNLYCDFKIKPILAHIERYKTLMDSKYALDDLLDMGCLTQVNISTFADAPHGTRKKLFKLLDAGKIHFIGSDSHNLTSRPPEYKEGAEMIIKKCGKEALETLIANANYILSDD